jgi:hypothetical protein
MLSMLTIILREKVRESLHPASTLTLTCHSIAMTLCHFDQRAMWLKQAFWPLQMTVTA